MPRLLTAIAILAVAFIAFTRSTVGEGDYKLYLPVVHKNYNSTPGFYLISHSQYATLPYVYTVGEILNHTSQTAYDMKVAVIFYDASQQVVGYHYSFAHYRAVTPEMKTPFLVRVQLTSSATTYSIAMSYDTSSSWIYIHDLAIVNASGYRNSFDTYRVVGEIRNDTPQAWQDVRSIVTLYDSSYVVVDAGYNDATYTDLAPGEVSPFFNQFLGAHLQSVTRYVIGVEGRRPSGSQVQALDGGPIEVELGSFALKVQRSIFP